MKSLVKILFLSILIASFARGGEGSSSSSEIDESPDPSSEIDESPDPSSETYESPDPSSEIDESPDPSSETYESPDPSSEIDELPSSAAPRDSSDRDSSDSNTLTTQSPTPGPTPAPTLVETPTSEGWDSSENSGPQSGDSSDSSPQSGDSSMERDPTSDGADSSGQSYAHDCVGKGVAYCRRPAVTETECPPVCADCEVTKKTSLTAVAKSKLFDYVYVHNNKICLARCHGRTKCSDWDVYKGVRHCKAIACRDKKGLEGCQDSSAYVVPNCLDCKLVFPRACSGKPVSSESDEWGDSSDGWLGHRVYMRAAAPWNSTNSTNTAATSNETIVERVFNVSNWTAVRAKNKTVKFRVVP